ncbi:PREDICTED: probable magnesium transporter NIPA8 isoform X3 [Camelina sativa]|uniref:Probable magnesium transporter n=1 Tax=Camelina sativa TaxID=90675 RepID=A0ABM0ZDQ7_CAMSA|nr:PREDICTED: probable magnesium transporter NIPA8 isoform X3 [Camelina sativa]
MGEWVIGAFINIFGSVAINFGTNLLKLGHNERERLALQDNGGGKMPLKPIIHFQTWRVGILVFLLGNCLNFISFGYAAQSLLAALGSIQFVSNIAFAYVVLNKMVTVKKGEVLISMPGQEISSYWKMLLPFSYAVVSGAIGSCSVLFAKSLSNLLRLAMSSSYQLHSWFTYSMLLLFLSTAGFWMTRLNEGLSLYDAILIVPMFQIAWTFFSICTGFIYFQEFQVFDALRTTMFILGMMCVFLGISLLAPDDTRGNETKDSSSSLDSIVSSSLPTEEDRLIPQSSEDGHSKDTRVHGMYMKAADLIAKTKTACLAALGFGEDSINASAILVMPMVSSKITGFRGNGLERAKILSMRGSGWSKLAMEEEGTRMLEKTVSSKA